MKKKAVRCFSKPPPPKTGKSQPHNPERKEHKILPGKKSPFFWHSRPQHLLLIGQIRFIKMVIFCTIHSTAPPIRYCTVWRCILQKDRLSFVRYRLATLPLCSLPARTPKKKLFFRRYFALGKKFSPVPFYPKKKHHSFKAGYRFFTSNTCPLSDQQEPQTEYTLFHDKSIR